MVKLNILTIILIEINLIYCEYIYLPLSTLPESYYYKNSFLKNATINDIMARELISPIFARLTLENRTKTIPIFIKPKTSYFLLTSYTQIKKTIQYTNRFYYLAGLYAYYFNETESKNKAMTCTKYKTNSSIAEEICNFNDTFIFNNKIDDSNSKKNYRINFNLARNSKDSITGVLGLNLYDEKNNEIKTNLLSILKANKAISYHYWYFNFSKWDDEEGNLVLGDYPHNLRIQNFSSNDLVHANLGQNFWEMEFDKIYFINTTNNDTISFYYENIEFNFDSNVIIGTNKYKRFLLLMLNDLINQNNCTKSNITMYEDEFLNINSTYDFFYCNNDNETINALNESIYSLYFYSSELDYTFEITKDQIIRTINDKIIINILFNNNENKANKWILGKPFIFKYKLVFIPQKKNSRLGFYNIYKNQIKNDSNNIIDNNTNTNNTNNHSDVINNEKKDSMEKVYKLIIIIPLIIYLCFGPIIIAWNKIKSKKNDLNDNIKNIDKEDDNKVGLINEDDDKDDKK